MFGQRFRQDENAFLICAFGSLDPFKREMRRVRKEFGLADKEIEFKDFGMGPIQRALPAYLETLNGYVPGLLFTLVVDKRLKSLFGSSHKSTLETLAQMLEARGVGRRRPHVAEKVMRVACTPFFQKAFLRSASRSPNLIRGLPPLADHDHIYIVARATGTNQPHATREREFRDRTAAPFRRDWARLI